MSKTINTSKSLTDDHEIGFHLVNNIVLIIAFIIVVAPLLNVVASSFSSPSAVIRGQVKFIPIDFNINAYKQILQSDMIITGYKNSIIYTSVGTCINIVMTLVAAYALSVKTLVGRNFFTGMFVFTMIFTAPLIPTYLNLEALGLLDSIWAMVLPNAISVFNLIIARTFFQNSISEEMLEASRIDGADDFTIFIKIIIPLSKSIIAVLVLYYAVAHWNSYFDAYIYLSSEEKLTLQVVLRNIMSAAKALQEMTGITEEQGERAALVEALKYAVIVVGSLPVILMYPFVQKHFVKGVMVGSIKG